MSEIRDTGVGYTYHVSTRCVDQTYLLHKNELKEIALKVIEKAKKAYDFNCFCFTIMDNHIHMIIHTPTIDNISLIMQVINKNIATKCNKELDRKGHFWGERFHSTIIKDEEQLINTLIYLNLNPVKAGLVYDPKDWEWGSYNTFVNNSLQNDLQDDTIDTHSLLQDNITDLPPCFTGEDDIQISQEYYQNLVLQRREEIILNFLYQQGYIKEDIVIKSKEQVLELLELYQRIQSQKWNDTTAKRRTPEEFL